MNRFWRWLEKLLNRRKLKDKRSPTARMAKRMEAEAAAALQKFSEQSGIGLLIEQYSWLFVVGFALLFLKNSIENILAGCAVFLDQNMTRIRRVGYR